MKSRELFARQANAVIWIAADLGRRSATNSPSSILILRTIPCHRSSTYDNGFRFRNA